MPVVVGIIDGDEKINALLPILEGLLRGGLVTVEKVRTLQQSVTSQRSA